MISNKANTTTDQNHPNHLQNNIDSNNYGHLLEKNKEKCVASSSIVVNGANGVKKKENHVDNDEYQTSTPKKLKDELLMKANNNSNNVNNESNKKNLSRQNENKNYDSDGDEDSFLAVRKHYTDQMNNG